MQIEHAIAIKFPAVELVATSKFLNDIIIAPSKALPNPIKVLFENFLFKTTISIIKIKKGANVPKKVACAMLVKSIAVKNNAKCKPSSIPA